MSKSTGQIDEAAIRKLAELLEETGLNEIEYRDDDFQVRVSRGNPIMTAMPQGVPAPVAAAPTPAAADAGGTGDGGGHPGAVTSPMVGVVYLSADPDSPPYVKVGDSVGEGDTLCLIEAMKVFNPIRAPRAGKVTRILVASGSPVEYGEPLIVVE